jgi:DNA mismatch repair protein MutS2
VSSSASEQATFATAILEFDGVRALVAGRTRTPMGRRRALSLAPSHEPREVARRQRLLAEALALGDEGELPAFPDLEEAEEHLDHLDVAGAVLEVEGLRNLARLAVAMADLTGGLRRRRREAPDLNALAESVPDLTPFQKATRGVFAAAGGLEDSASPQLASVRRRLVTAGERLRRKMATYLSAPEAERYLRDEYVTQRGGRFVIPVRADHRAAVNGIVHGSSTTGVTLFVEPLETVDLNNDLVRLQEEERVEVARVLAALTEEARRCRHGLRQAADVVAALDLITASARLGLDYEARPARLEEGSRITLVEMRHILLEERLRGEGSRAVPVTLHMEEPERVLVISGPNTGGKTVALKTVGLAALMNQAGLPVPARDAALPVFSQVLADIGDHQSITENLSTFSSHVSALVRMTSRVEPPALVLIDELGTGTDPEEGAALGVAVVEFFRRREALVVVTTHHNGLKAYAETTAGVRNAAVEFDEATLRPTYRLLDGVAGRSGGLDIAARLGLAPEIVENAQALVPESGRVTQRYITRLADLAAGAERDREAARELLREAEAEKDRSRGVCRKEEEEHRRRLEAALEMARKRFGRNMAEVLDRLEGVMGRERARREQERAKEEFSRRMRRERDQVHVAADAPLTAAPGPLQEGDRVRLDTFGGVGVVERLEPGKRLAVTVAGKRLVVGAGSVTRLTPGPVMAPPRVQVDPAPGDDLPGELHLLGQRVEEALERLDRYLDRAILAGRSEIRVIHGHGTGRLRRAVRQHLRDHPTVADQRPGGPSEGGEGATVIRLRG